MRIDMVTMFTSEIAVAEINMLRDEMTLVLPSDLEVYMVSHLENQTFITIKKKETTP